MNTNLQRAIERAIVGLALLFSMGMANATTTSLGDLTLYGDAGYTATVVVPGKLTFTDIYTFSIPSLSNVTGDLFSLTRPSKYNIHNLNLTLMDSANNVLQQDPTSIAQLLSTGAYSFTVTGNTVGNKGGIYIFNASAALVPEPSTWAMMLGGLGLIGFMSYRRRQYF